MNKYIDPARTLYLLQQLEGLGMSDSAFSVLHHFSKPESIASHRNYCQVLVDEGARFRTANNPRVQKRLEMVLSMYKAGGFTSSSHGVFEHLAKAAALELPVDPRPLSE
jgi:hypothetical protein